jgi:Holliday junction resolvase RusA-like endonuclease
MSHISFFIAGLPAPGGSKRFVGHSKKTGRAILIDAAGQRNKDWKANVGWNAQKAMEGRELETGPLSVTMTFFMPRPKYHFRANGTIKESAPKYPTTKPDTLKLTRSTEDAMTGIVWHDDAQTVDLILRKRFQATGQSLGCLVEISRL